MKISEIPVGTFILLGAMLIFLALILPAVLLFALHLSGLSLFGLTLPSLQFTTTDAILLVAVAAFARDGYRFYEDHK